MKCWQAPTRPAWPESLLAASALLLPLIALRRIFLQAKFCLVLGVDCLECLPVAGDMTVPRDRMLVFLISIYNLGT